VRQIYPPGQDGQPPDLAALYAYPAGLDRAWVRANMIESADGAAALDGLSGGLSGPGDREVFGVLRALADVILVGAGTARDEKYQPARVRPARAGLRAGRPAAPPIAVLSGRLDLDLASPLLSSAAGGPAPDARTIVITGGVAAAHLRAAVAAHADVIVAGERQVDLAAAVAALAGRGHQRILAEGGPRLLGQLAAAGLVDELCVTVSPVLTGGPAGRIIQGPAGGAGPARLDLAHVLADDGYLFCRYLVNRG
jgi:riboflavin biosynthesis pyrimidine reductase